MITATKTKRAVGYLRVSTVGQSGDNHNSLDTQQSRFEEYCLRLGLTPVTTFAEISSGRKDDRQEYRRMIDFVLSGNADIVVVQFLDRFGRNPREILQRIWELENHGVKVAATDEDIEDELILLIKAGIAGAESKRTSERVRSNMSRAVGKGVHAARAPYGYRRVYEGRDKVSWEQDPDEARNVKRMVQYAVDENLGFKAIADRLTDLGQVAKTGRPFASYTIQKILSNEALMGDLVYGKKPRKGNPTMDLVRLPSFFPAILAGEEWDALQLRLSIRRETSRGRTHASPYLLSGIAKCGNCGGPMSGKVGSMWKGKRYRNYYCSRAMRSRALCDTYNGHSAQKLEAAVLDYLGQFSDSKTVIEKLDAAKSGVVKKTRNELSGIERALDGVEAEFHKRMDLLSRGILTEEEFVKANEGLRRKRVGLETCRDEIAGWLDDQIGKTNAAERLPISLRSFREDFESMDVRQQKARLQTILSAVHVYKGEKLEIEFRT